MFLSGRVDGRPRLAVLYNGIAEKGREGHYPCQPKYNEVVRFVRRNPPYFLRQNERLWGLQE